VRRRGRRRPPVPQHDGRLRGARTARALVTTHGDRRGCCGTRGTAPHGCFRAGRGHWGPTRRSLAAGTVRFERVWGR
jgi:hypothetical protein